MQSLPVQLKVVLDVPIGDIDMVTTKPCSLVNDLLCCTYKTDKGIERVPSMSQVSREAKTATQFTSA